MVNFGETLNDVLPVVRDASALALSMQTIDDLSAQMKADGSPVTIADKAIEAFIRQRLERLYPDDGLQGEESDGKHSRSGRIWTIDPIDGTIQYMRGQEFWSILLGLDDKQGGNLGIIAFPARGEIIYAERDKGCYEESNSGTRRLQVSKVANISEAYVLHNGLSFAERAGQAANLGRLVTSSFAERGYADAFGHLEVIRGRADLMIDFLTEYHDIAPVRVAVAEAGGLWSGLDGTPSLSSGGCISTNGLLHSEVVEYFTQEPGYDNI